MPAAGELLPVSLAISAAGQFFRAELIVETQFGLSVFDLLNANNGETA